MLVVVRLEETSADERDAECFEESVPRNGGGSIPGHLTRPRCWPAFDLEVPDARVVPQRNAAGCRCGTDSGNAAQASDQR